MAITKLNSLAIPPNTIVESDLSYPLTNFSSTGIDDNATSTKLTVCDSGIDVTGTATIDGLTVDGNDSYTSNIRFTYGTSGPTYFADWGNK